MRLKNENGVAYKRVLHISFYEVKETCLITYNVSEIKIKNRITKFLIFKA